MCTRLCHAFTSRLPAITSTAPTSPAYSRAGVLASVIAFLLVWVSKGQWRRAVAPHRVVIRSAGADTAALEDALDDGVRERADEGRVLGRDERARTAREAETPVDDASAEAEPPERVRQARLNG